MNPKTKRILLAAGTILAVLIITLIPYYYLFVRPILILRSAGEWKAENIKEDKKLFEHFVRLRFCDHDALMVLEHCGDGNSVRLMVKNLEDYEESRW